MWHAKTLKNRLRAWARNKTLGFIITVFSVFLTLGIWVYGEFIRTKTVVPAHNTGNATTSGPNSPAVSGDGNNVTYSEPLPANKKEAQKPKE
jgi:hypothetical protein